MRNLFAENRIARNQNCELPKKGNMPGFFPRLNSCANSMMVWRVVVKEKVDVLGWVHIQCVPSLIRCFRFFSAMLLMMFLASCGGGGGSAGSTPPVSAATASLSFTAVKTFRFDWTDVADASHYRLLENPDGNSGFTQVGDDIPQGQQTVDHIVPLYQRINASYILQSCNSDGCTDGATLAVSGTLQSAIGYFKASNTGASDRFGISVSVSGDGNTLAVGAPGEASADTGVDANQNDNTVPNAGAVYVFQRSGSSWNQQAFIKASNTGGSDLFGQSVSLSDDGNTLAVGAHGEASAATGINGDEADNSAGNAGAVYVFSRTGSSWQQQAYIKASNAGAGDTFGQVVDLSGDGNTLAVGARLEGSAATDIGGDQNDNSAGGAGAVYVFSRSGSSWQQQAYIKASNTEASDFFGVAVSLSGDGDTLAVGAYQESSADTGIDGDQGDNTASASGAVYVYSRSGSVWQQQAYVKASNTGANDEFGFAVSLDADGNTLAVGARSEASAATGIDGDQSDNTSFGAGAVYVYTRSGSAWQQQAYVKASNTRANNQFGVVVNLSDDGNALAVAADLEGSLALGIGGDQSDDSAVAAGAVYVFARSGSVWQQQAYVKAANTEASDEFGFALSLSADGQSLAVGAFQEDSATLGVNGDQADNTAVTSGAVYLY